MKPVIILVISILLESAVLSCALGIYLVLVRAFGFDKSFIALREGMIIFLKMYFKGVMWLSSENE